MSLQDNQVDPSFLLSSHNIWQPSCRRLCLSWYHVHTLSLEYKQTGQLQCGKNTYVHTIVQIKWFLRSDLDHGPQQAVTAKENPERAVAARLRFLSCLLARKFPVDVKTFHLGLKKVMFLLTKRWGRQDGHGECYLLLYAQSKKAWLRFSFVPKIACQFAKMYEFANIGILCIQLKCLLHTSILLSDPVCWQSRSSSSSGFNSNSHNEAWEVLSDLFLLHDRHEQDKKRNYYD